VSPPKSFQVKDLEQLATRLMSVSEDAPEPWIAMGHYCYVNKKGSRYDTSSSFKTVT